MGFLNRLLPLVFVAASAAFAQSVPESIFTDPKPDKEHPAKMTVIHVPSHGVNINGVVYQPTGAGPHPTVVICHGLPGNEKNLDLAQALRRAGWNAVTFNYRGSWGSPGNFRFIQNIEDAKAVLAYLRDPSNSAKLAVDTKRIAIVGHSMGGWVVAHTASADKGLIGAVLISAADMGLAGLQPREKAVAMMADDLESLAGVTAESMADEVRENSKAFRFDNAAAGLTQVPLLVVTSDDGLKAHTDLLIKAMQAKGGGKLATKHFATDHSYSDHRIALEAEVIRWLGTFR
jgi:pimeloyl-ACP methyl ester carboxylesterase